MDAMTRSGPVPDEDSQPFWDALSKHRILLQTCTNCGEVRCPPLPACANCGATGWTASDATGIGALYSWIEVHRPIGTIGADEVPCTIATVQLDEGPRMVGRLNLSTPTIGSRVAARFVDHDTWTEIAFVTVEEPAREASE